MDCTDLRTMAAWAGGTPDRVLPFQYDGDPDASPPRLRIAEGPVPGPEWVETPTRTVARPPLLSSVQVQVQYRPQPGAPPVRIEGTLEGAGRWDAAFWSESAVEKFVGPYLAGLGGPCAAQVLQLQALAWNGYPAERQAFGVLHRSMVDPQTRVDIGNLLEVAFVDVAGRRVDVLPLAEFARHCHEPPPPGDSRPVPYRSGRVDRPGTLPDELVVRHVAEWASALRDEAFYFVFDTATGRLHGPLATLPQELEGRLVFPVHTPPNRPDRPIPLAVSLKVAHRDPKEFDLREADAAFWGSGAVDHVMVPYYASVYGSRALRQLSRILRTWNRAAPLPGEAGEEEVVYALVHLPKSDWDTSATVVGERVGVAFARGSGETQVLPFNRFAGRRA